MRLELIGRLLRRISQWQKGEAEQEIERTKGVGTWRLAEDYLKGARALDESWPKVSFVSYFLYGHALELAFKSFLISQGSTNSSLKRIGHDLKRALRAARRHEPFEHVVLSDQDRVVIAWLGAYYKDKEFEYLFTGSKSLPISSEVRSVCERVLASIRPLVWQAAHQEIAFHERSI